MKNLLDCRENKDLKETNEILKKVVAIFSREEK